MISHLLLLGLAIAGSYFAIVWAISVKIRNYGLLDVAWSYGVAVLAPLDAAMGPGPGPRKWLAASLGALWSLRLGSYILRRVLRHHPKEDPRYGKLRQSWPGTGKFLLFFELQAVVAVIFSLPFLFAAFNPSPELSGIEIAGLVLGAVALCGEALADWQMSRFKADPANKERVCEAGLWSLSRHPNYFFEATVWVGFFLFALGSPHGWICAACPLLMLYFLLRVTGIPLTEEYSLLSKGDTYRDYQRRVSAFFPWFPKRP